jgi:two-component system, NtrC family, response regulator
MNEQHFPRNGSFGFGFEGILDPNPAMRSVIETIRKVATSDVPVLLLGESATGREMAARAIHMGSRRKEGPLVAINCRVIPETLLEVELFGYEEGAFTGADSQRNGRFESADKGTLFLDDIGEIPLQVQVKLLRFLHEKCIGRLGGQQSIPIDARLVTATNADLRKGIRAGTFREDLYYRMGVVQIVLPQL